ncbi:hypothetical protein N5F13_03370 [Comamonas thiooxydans]|uniref:vWA domain-containing protein n=1 Tax=Comamonas thiooxydans TaxID=363952 RepID=UPI00244855F5|nr:hypothetical protein [Comamonas thiooxydans]MDH1473522.1 hypothetical protein [Comamonas thiooxydans]
MELPDGLPQRDEAQWYVQFCEQGIPAWAQALSLAGPGQGGAHPSLALPEQWPEPASSTSKPQPYWRRYGNWPEMFAAGLARSVTQSVEMAAGVRREFGQSLPASSALDRARHWFMDSFPLLGSMVAAFDIIEDASICEREDIAVAAVDEMLRTIYINPGPHLSELELRFVIAHEVLHVALRHLPRRRGREPFLWNVACDFVINDWLIQMDVGQPPGIGLLYDPELRGLGAEEVYDRIASDLRRMRKLRTLAGGRGDMLERNVGDQRGAGDFTDIDEFCRTQLGKGLLRHEQSARGLLPAGLIEEIRALLQPPVDWQVDLARWFDHHFPPIETRRSYARISRRQSATPDIPRPRIQADSRWLEGRTFGVVLDTSGSMERHVLAQSMQLGLLRPLQPLAGTDLELHVNHAVDQRRGHGAHNRGILGAVASRNHDGALGHQVLAHAALQSQAVEGFLHILAAGVEFVQEQAIRLLARNHGGRAEAGHASCGSPLMVPGTPACPACNTAESDWQQGTDGGRCE